MNVAALQANRVQSGPVGLPLLNAVLTNEGDACRDNCLDHLHGTCLDHRHQSYLGGVATAPESSLGYCVAHGFYPMAERQIGLFHILRVGA
jgi:hypothetical protein